MRYLTSKYAHQGKVNLYPSKYLDDRWLMESSDSRRKYEYVLDETTHVLSVRNTETKEDIMAITPDGKVVIRIPYYPSFGIDRATAQVIMGLYATLFGQRILILNRFKKNRVYVYPEKEDWIDWDASLLVKKYVVDDNAVAVIFDMNGNILHGATPQKNPSNGRPKVNHDTGINTRMEGKKTETEW